MKYIKLIIIMFLLMDDTFAADLENSQDVKKEAEKLISEYEVFFSLCKEGGTLAVSEIEITKTLSDDSKLVTESCIEN